MHNPSEDLASSAERVLQLPTDFSRTPSSKARLETYPFELEWPAEALAPEALIAAAFGISLQRYGGQPSVAFDVSRSRASGGSRALPLLLRFDADTRARDVVAQASEQLLGGQTPPVTGEGAVAAGAGVGAAGAAGEGATAARAAGEGATAARAAGESGDRAALTWLESWPSGGDVDGGAALAGASFGGGDVDLHLVVGGAGGSGRAAFVYDASRFRRASVERFAGHLRTLLAALVAQPEAPVARLPMLTPGERQWLESVCEGRRRPLPAEPAHRLFERHAAEAPGAVAVRYRDEALPYGELNQRANRLARHLVAAGVGAESRVAVCVEPSFDIAVALLGVLKAGGVYVPVDPTYPAARVRAILDDTTPALVLSQAHLVERLGLGDFATFLFDDEARTLGGRDGDNLAVAVDPGQTAYIYYTSGTTGKPKGVMASHANLVAYLDVARERYEMSGRDVMPAIARFSFSISMFELMSPLTAGGTLVVLDREHVLDPARMAATLATVTIFHAGPSLLKHLVPYVKRHYTSFDAFAGVRHASSGGDLIAPELLGALQEIFSEAEVFVIYGCSEVSCMGCTYPVPRGEAVTKTYVGRPFDNVAVRVLDGAFNPVPAGVIGEIHFAGGGVVKGYLNRPELTAEKFVELEGRRFYRTGDVGRLSEAGWLEILGRNDFQVKLRGMRIELGEVEFALRRGPGVRDAVVMAKDGPGGERALVAYVVYAPTEGGNGVDGDGERRARAGALRRHMVESLPDYMVPAAYVELASLPVNHNLKVDRNALPEPEWAGQRDAVDPLRREPETPTERRLAALWAKLLGAPHVGLDDNFFELGGHSLLGTSLLAEVRREFGVTLEGMEVLRETLEVLASFCDARLGKAPRPVARSSALIAVDTVEPFHFGPAGSLYGVLHSAGGSTAREAALLCAPVGEEHVRARFVLGRLARRLAARGVPTMRFDYYGCGDSLGESGEATCGRWRRDVEDACRELRRRTGAASVAAVGVRLGATLLCNAAGDLGLSRLILWDPVCDGAEYYAEMAVAHRHYVSSMQHLRLGRAPARLPGAEELLGTTYSDAALRELRGLSITRDAPNQRLPFKWLVTSQPARQRGRFAALSGARTDCRVETLDFDCSWHDVARLEDVLPDVGIAAALANMVTERA